MPALITRCPACATMFKVVPDQLRVSEGWVRCGHCGEVFDASAHLQPAAALAQAQASAPAPSARDEGVPLARDEAPPAAPAAVPAAAVEAEPPMDSELLSEPTASAFGSSLHTHIDEELLEAESGAAEVDPAAHVLQEDPRDRPFALRREDLGAAGELEPASAAAPPVAEEPEPTFVRQARREARWQRPAVRALLALAALALAALLAAQVAVQERDRLAAAEPGLRPWLAMLCEPLDCRIAPLRRIDAIAIDGSSFNTLRPDAYRLQVTLRNQGRVDVAMPAIELTLTDSGEQPVVRRVLAPAELGAVRPALAAGAEWSGAVALALSDTSLAGRVAGYRVLAFYP